MVAIIASQLLFEVQPTTVTGKLYRCRIAIIRPARVYRMPNNICKWCRVKFFLTFNLILTIVDYGFFHVIADVFHFEFQVDCAPVIMILQFNNLMAHLKQVICFRNVNHVRRSDSVCIWFTCTSQVLLLTPPTFGVVVGICIRDV